jgi:hypothetical protein
MQPSFHKSRLHPTTAIVKTAYTRKERSHRILQSGAGAHLASYTMGRLRLKCDGTRPETRFRLSAKRTSPFKSAGASVQSTTGSRGVHISGSTRCSPEVMHKFLL